MAKVLNISAADVVRLCRHAEIQSLLSSLTDDDLQELISRATVKKQTLFSRISVVELGAHNIEIKQINIAELELTRENFTATTNLFDLPLYLHYGNHSPGFGVWREISATTTATNWALSGLCPHFQMMYYWRVLPKPESLQQDPDLMASSIKAMEFWGEADGVMLRYQENLASAAEMVIFSEYIPFTLEKWLNEQVLIQDVTRQPILQQIDDELTQLTQFCQAHGLIHFQPNFENILTDGDRLFLSNFNLAMCKSFDLYGNEINFYNRHEGYDALYVKSCLIKWMMTILSTTKHHSDDDRQRLNFFLDHDMRNMPEAILELVKQYAQAAHTMFDFAERFKSSREARIQIR